MKQTISILLALILTLGLCACSKDNSNSADSKYVGTYENSYTTGSLNLSYTARMELHPNGTGTYTEVTTNAAYPNIPVGTTIAAGTASWKVSDGYVIITCTYTNYLYKGDTPSEWLLTASDKEETTETFELKGSKLINVEHDWNTWDKVK